MQAWCPAQVATGSSGELLCVTSSGTAVPWQQPPVIDFAAVASPFSAGFLLVATFWALGHGVAMVIKLAK